ncbi:MAG: hypothetical protein ABIQ43_02250 [Sphingomonas sp.]
MHNNDNGSETNGATHPSSESHGHAALLLVESLIHGLCENSTLSTSQAVEIAERALEVQFDQAEAADGAGAPLWQSHALLSAITESLRSEARDAPPPPPRLVP